MKRNILDFVHRGLVACGLGPMILVILYLILQRQCAVETLTVNEVCMGILTLSLLAFIAGGMNFIYQIEQLPLMVAIFIHGGVLYISYLVTYLLNGWLASGVTPVLVFTGIFVLGYFAIWVVIYFVTKKNAAKVTAQLQKKQQHQEL